MKLITAFLLCAAILVSGQDPADQPDTTTTSTPKPTTSEPPKTTTAATTTVKPPPPAPTVAPTPAPSSPNYPRNVGKWSVENATGSFSCIVLRGAIQIAVTQEVDNKTTPFTLDVPQYALANGTCDWKFQAIKLFWNSTVPNNNRTGFEENFIVFHFDRTEPKVKETTNGITEGKYGIQNITISVYPLNTTVKPVERSLTDLAVFQTPMNHSYTCHAEETLKSATGDLIVRISEVQYEPYRYSTPGHQEFSTPIDCPADDATDVVPIAVGAALAGLVVIVLIAYLIGRRRSRARGYQSV